MKSQPALLCAALLFWGFMTHMIPLAIILAATATVPCFIKTRWDFSRREIGHATDISIILLLAILAAGFIEEKTVIIYKVVTHLPLVLFPLILTQRFSQRGSIDVLALRFTAWKTRKNDQAPIRKDLLLPYLLICLISAGAKLHQTNVYYPGIVILLLWIAQSIRSPRTHMLKWLLLVGLSIGLSLVGNRILRTAHDEIIERTAQDQMNPLKTTTSLGQIGYQKMSDRILFRVHAERLNPTPLLLREASYNRFLKNNWHAIQSRSGEITATSTQKNWSLINAPKEMETASSFQIELRARKGTAVLPLPAGTFALHSLPVGSIETNQFGAVVVQGAKTELLRFQPLYNPKQVIDGKPNANDVLIPDEEASAIRSIVNELQLEGLTPRQTIQTLSSFFDQQFSYTLERDGTGKQKTALAHFLLDRRAGHCEFFATATTLILRECNIPARYTIGYAASEYSPLEHCFVVRERHGHAWTRVWIDGHWENLDTTSSNWLSIEESQRNAPFQLLRDLGSYLGMLGSRLRWNEQDRLPHLVAGLLILLIISISTRLRKQLKTKKKKSNKPVRPLIISKQGIDSGFAQLEQQLTQKGYPRNNGESLTHWTARIQKAAPELLDYPKLESVIRHHYQHRFGSTPLPEQPRKKLQLEIHQLNQSLENPPASSGTQSAG